MNTKLLMNIAGGIGYAANLATTAMVCKTTFKDMPEIKKKLNATDDKAFVTKADLKGLEAKVNENGGKIDEAVTKLSGYLGQPMAAVPQQPQQPAPQPQPQQYWNNQPQPNYQQPPQGGYWGYQQQPNYQQPPQGGYQQPAPAQGQPGQNLQR